MSNSIWKTPKETPRQEQLVAWVDRNGMHAGRFDTCYNCFCACADYRADLRKVKRWCSLENLEDLIAQADKAERLQKALCFIRNIRGAGMSYQDMFLDAHEVAKAALDPEYKPILCGRYDGETLAEIKQLIKGE